MEFHDPVERLLGARLMEAEIADTEKATGWTVVTTCAEFGSVKIYGVFDRVVDAFAYAINYGAELNREMEDPEGWKVDVLPVMPPEKIHDPRISYAESLAEDLRSVSSWFSRRKRP